MRVNHNNNMQKRFSKLELFLYIVVILCVISLLAVNLFFTSFLSVDKAALSDNSDILLKDSVLYREKYFIKLSISDIENCDILINGSVSDVQPDEHGYITIEVYNNDVVHLDMRRSMDESVSVFVEEVSNGLVVPEQSSKIIVEGGIKKIFTVEIKQD